MVYPHRKKKAKEVVTSCLPHPIAAASERRIGTCDAGCSKSWMGSCTSNRRWIRFLTFIPVKACCLSSPTVWLACLFQRLRPCPTSASSCHLHRSRWCLIGTTATPPHPPFPFLHPRSMAHATYHLLGSHLATWPHNDSPPCRPPPLSGQPATPGLLLKPPTLKP